MKTKYCVVCGSIEQLQQHHFIPMSLGGKEEDNNIITLCTLHHNFIHKMEGKLNHNQLIKKTKEKRKRENCFAGGHLPFGYKAEKIIGKHKSRSGYVSNIRVLEYDYKSIDYKILYDIMTLFDNNTMTYREFDNFIFKKYKRKVHYTQIHRIKKREENLDYWKNIKCTN